MKKEYFYNNLTYKVVAHKASVHGVTALLLSPGNNWIVANGLNIRDTTELPEATIYHGDWNHGHYFMENETEAKRYFNSVPFPVEEYWKY